MTTIQISRFSDEAKRANWRKSFLAFEAIFYFFQGVYLTGMQTFLAVRMAEFGLTLSEQASFSALIGLPTYLKMFIGLLSDRLPFARLGRRKPYIALGALLYVPGFAVLFGVKGFNGLWVAAAVAVQIAWVMVDTTLDALTVDVTPDEHSGAIQGAAQGARMLGMGAGILLIPLLGPKIGWDTALILIAVFALIQGAAALLFRELPVDREQLRTEMPLGQVIKRVFSRRLSWLSILFSVFFMGSIGLSSVISAYLLTELGWAADPALMAVYGTANLVHYGAAALGSAVAGRFIARYKNNPVFYAVVSILFWVSILPWFLVGSSGERMFWVYAAQLTYGIGRGMMTVLVYSVVMRVCPKSLEGFMFATLTSAMNFGLYTITPKTMAFFTERIGLAPSMFSAVPYTIIGLLALGLILRDLAKQESVRDVVPERGQAPSG
ncbi:MAG: MFS transporter [Anaerolineae bacterium]|nr:MFS transporter [Anaerolineae bacterium]